MPALVHRLFDGPLDIVGDIHGEIDAILSLLKNLGYDENGRHVDGRRLAFLGDLTDRGPDSSAVIDLVSQLRDSGRAQCVLGNHDLNLLLDHRKPENGWFWGEEFRDENGRLAPQVLADDGIRRRTLALFASLPLVLERDDLRIVHACWDDSAVRIAREAKDAAELYETHRREIEQLLPGLSLDRIDGGLQHQNRNPVKLLTSGPEERTETPITAGGKVRYERRVRWWEKYDSAFCVFGHYSISDGQPRGDRSAFCVDYGIGQRWKERRAGKVSGFSYKLAALRLPEKQIVFDEGDTCNL